MKILIAGSRGMLGSDLMLVFRGSADVTGYDIDEMDITDPARCRLLVTELGPDVVINAAALTQVDYCESHQEEAFRVNAQGAGNLAAAAAETGALLVHYSTDYVFDGRKSDPYVEEDPTNPLSVYGRSKLQGEELVRSRGDRYLILRTSWLFGCSGANFIRMILGRARSGQDLRVVDDQRGSPTYAADLASKTAQLVDAGCLGIFHVTNSGWCTWYELARSVLESAGLTDIQVTPVSTAEFPRPAPRPANSILANARLARSGLPLMRHWTGAVSEYVREFEQAAQKQ